MSWFFAAGSGHEESFGASAAILQVPDLASSAHNALLSVPSGSLGADTLQQTWVPALAVLARRVGLAAVGFSDRAVRAGSSGDALVVVPVGGGRTLLREGLALVALFVVTVGAVACVGNARCSVPFGAFGTSVLEVNALFSVEEFPWQASITWVRADALSSIEEGVGWASEINTRLTIPTLVGRTSWVTADLLGGQEDQPRRTNALIN